MSKGLIIVLKTSLGFAPLMLFWSIDSFMGILLGLGGIMVKLLLEIKNRNITMITKTITIYFAILMLAYYVYDTETVLSIRHMLSYAILGLMAIFSILINKPFTMDESRSSYPSYVIEHPEFIRVNKIITFVWALVYIGSLVARLISATGLVGNLPTGFIIIGMILSVILPDVLPRYQE